MKANKYTTISIEKGTKTMLDFLRAKKGKSLSVIVHGVVKAEYEKEFGSTEVFCEQGSGHGNDGDDSAESGAIPIVG